MHQHHPPASEKTEILHGENILLWVPEGKRRTASAIYDLIKLSKETGGREGLWVILNMCLCILPRRMTVQIYFCFQGNYDQYVKTREELEENQMKRFNWEQDQIAHMKVNEWHRVVKCCHCTKSSKSIQSQKSSSSHKNGLIRGIIFSSYLFRGYFKERLSSTSWIIKPLSELLDIYLFKL